MSVFEAQLTSIARTPILPGLCFAILSDIPLFRPRRYAEWTDDALRSVLLAHLQHCPESELDAAVQRARDEAVWLEQEERWRTGAEAAHAGVN